MNTVHGDCIRRLPVIQGVPWIRVGWRKNRNSQGVHREKALGPALGRKPHGGENDEESIARIDGVPVRFAGGCM